MVQKRAAKYTVAIALVGALAGGCKKNLPEEEANYMQDLAGEIQDSMKEESPDKEKIDLNLY